MSATTTAGAVADELAWSIAGEIERVMGSCGYIDTRTDPRVIGELSARSDVLDDLRSLQQWERDVIADSPFGHRGPYGPPVIRSRRAYVSPEAVFEEARSVGVAPAELLSMILHHESLVSRRWSGTSAARQDLAEEAEREAAHWDDMAEAEREADLYAYRQAWDYLVDVEMPDPELAEVLAAEGPDPELAEVLAAEGPAPELAEVLDPEALDPELAEVLDPELAEVLDPAVAEVPELAEVLEPQWYGVIVAGDVEWRRRR